MQFQFYKIALARCPEPAAAALEPHRLPLISELGKEHKRRRKRRVAAQIHFHRRRERAQVEEAVLFREERCFREVVLRRNPLKPRIRQPLFQSANTCWIPAERRRRERVNLIIGNTHKSAGYWLAQDRFNNALGRLDERGGRGRVGWRELRAEFLLEGAELAYGGGAIVAPEGGAGGLEAG